MGVFGEPKAKEPGLESGRRGRVTLAGLRVAAHMGGAPESESRLIPWHAVVVEPRRDWAVAEAFDHPRPEVSVPDALGGSFVLGAYEGVLARRLVVRARRRVLVSGEYDFTILAGADDVRARLRRVARVKMSLYCGFIALFSAMSWSQRGSNGPASFFVLGLVICLLLPLLIRSFRVAFMKPSMRRQRLASCRVNAQGVGLEFEEEPPKFIPWSSVRRLHSSRMVLDDGTRYTLPTVPLDFVLRHHQGRNVRSVAAEDRLKRWQAAGIGVLPGVFGAGLMLALALRLPPGTSAAWAVWMAPLVFLVGLPYLLSLAQAQPQNSFEEAAKRECKRRRAARRRRSAERPESVVPPHAGTPTYSPAP
ncbi:MAG TPA: hypothetical protein PL072_00180 [Phycisphaerales bacterium]|nr:hypothetical protein [Phycisphaerales bacterium]